MPLSHFKLNNIQIKEYFDFHGQRVEALRMLLNAVIKTQSISIKKCANAAQSNVLDESNERRFERLMENTKLEPTNVARLIAYIVGIDMTQKHTLILDRTYWPFGQTHINILTLAVVHNNVAIPLFIEFLGTEMLHGKKGNSSVSERMELLDCYDKTFGKETIAVLLGDREFAGHQWNTTLRQEKIPYVLRLKECGLLIQNRCGEMTQIHRYAEGFASDIVYDLGLKTLGKTKPFRENVALLKLSPNLQKEAAKMKSSRGSKNSLNKMNKALKKAADLLGQPFEPKSEVIALCYSEGIADPFGLYRTRWTIESLFRSLKSGGFHIEDTSVSHPKRIVFLIYVAMIALAMCFQVGVLSNEIRPIPIKKHGFKAETFIQRGLRNISTFFLQYVGKKKVDIEFKKVLTLITPWKRKSLKLPIFLSIIDNPVLYAA